MHLILLSNRKWCKAFADLEKKTNDAASAVASWMSFSANLTKRFWSYSCCSHHRMCPRPSLWLQRENHNSPQFHCYLTLTPQKKHAIFCISTLLCQQRPLCCSTPPGLLCISTLLCQLLPLGCSTWSLKHVSVVFCDYGSALKETRHFACDHSYKYASSSRMPSVLRMWGQQAITLFMARFRRCAWHHTYMAFLHTPWIKVAIPTYLSRMFPAPL